MPLLCDTPELVNNAAAQLRGYPHIFLDCEGRDLGDDTGALSAISIAAPNAATVYIIDALSLDVLALKPILELLQSNKVAKVVWDGRMDAIEMQRTFGISMQKVWDLQILDITTRKLRRDPDGRKYVDRPWHPLKLVAHMNLDDVHALTSLKKAFKTHFITDTVPAEPVGPFDHSRWMDRPLPEGYLTYAEADIKIIHRMFLHFTSRHYMGKKALSVLEQQTRRYLAIHSEPVSRDNKYICSNLLPLEVLDAPLNGPTSKCDKCLRVLSRNSFFYADLRFDSMKLHATCKTCNILVEREKARTLIAEEQAQKEQETGEQKSKVKPVQQSTAGEQGGSRPPRRGNNNSSRRRRRSSSPTVTIDDWVATLRDTGFHAEANDITGENIWG